MSTEEGEEDDESLETDGDALEIVLGSSKMGVMRKGPLLIRKTHQVDTWRSNIHRSLGD